MLSSAFCWSVLRSMPEYVLLSFIYVRNSLVFDGRSWLAYIARAFFRAVARLSVLVVSSYGSLIHMVDLLVLARSGPMGVSAVPARLTVLVVSIEMARSYPMGVSSILARSVHKVVFYSSTSQNRLDSLPIDSCLTCVDSLVCLG